MATHTVNSSMTFAQISTTITNASSGDTVYFSAGTYDSNTVSDRIICKTGVNLNGAGASTIIYGHYNGAMVDDKSTKYAYIQGYNVSNVTISNINFKSDATGSQDDGSGLKTGGGHFESRNCIYFDTGSNITVHDCNATTFLYLDFFRVRAINGSYMYNCSVPKIGHAAYYAFKSNIGRVYNNTVAVYTNAGLRLDGSTNIEFDHNTIAHGAGGQAAIELQNSVSGLNIHHNVIYDFDNLAVVQSLGASGSVNYHDNVVWNSGAVQLGSGTGNIDANSLSHDVNYWKNHSPGYGAGAGVGADTDSETDPTPPPPDDPPVVTFRLTSISPTSHEVGTFDITMNGEGFDTSSSEVEVYDGDTLVGDGYVQSRTSTRIVASHVFNYAALYSIRVVNPGTINSAFKTLTVTANPIISVPCRFALYSRNGSVVNKYW